jgi:hypothetical protein
MGQFAREPWLAVTRGHELVLLTYRQSPVHFAGVKPRRGPLWRGFIFGLGYAHQKGAGAGDRGQSRRHEFWLPPGRDAHPSPTIRPQSERVMPHPKGRLCPQAVPARRIDSVYRKLRQMQDEDKRLAVKPVKGKFRTISIDPPWAYTAGERSRPTYTTMSQK